jgi:trans-2-enoyl-CoA reductase
MNVARIIMDLRSELGRVEQAIRSASGPNRLRSRTAEVPSQSQTGTGTTRPQRTISELRTERQDIKRAVLSLAALDLLRRRK